MIKKSVGIIVVICFVAAIVLLFGGLVIFQNDDEQGNGVDKRNDFNRPVWEREKVNFVVIYTDDQRWDTMGVMPIVKKELADRGTTFDNAFVRLPLCCPSRASFLSGGFFPASTGVKQNGGVNGGAGSFYDLKNIGKTFQENGYRTALVGKYLNAYGDISPRIPPGWDVFFIILFSGKWDKYNGVEGSSTAGSPGKGEVKSYNDYLLDVEKEKALKFIDDNYDEPFFLFYSTNSPHDPATPAERDKNLFSDYNYRDRGWGEEDLSDKPEWVGEVADDFWRGNPDFFEEDDFIKGSETPDDFIKNQLRTLQYTDRAVGEIISKLEEKGIADKTVVIYTSDNGFMWGEHGIFKKGVPYEESVHVPLIVYVPEMEKQTISEMISVDEDLAATLFDMAEIESESDGESVAPLVLGENFRWREHFISEGFGSGAGDFPIWASIRDSRYKYIQYASGEEELYDLQADPFELESKHDSPSFLAIKESLKRLLEGERALGIATTELPDAEVGKEYRFALEGWGGKKPYTWRITEGNLPDGLELTNDGIIIGTTESKMGGKFTVQVSDSFVSKQHGGSDKFSLKFNLRVKD